MTSILRSISISYFLFTTCLHFRRFWCWWRAWNWFRWLSFRFRTLFFLFISRLMTHFKQLKRIIHFNIIFRFDVFYDNIPFLIALFNTMDSTNNNWKKETCSLFTRQSYNTNDIFSKMLYWQLIGIQLA